MGTLIVTELIASLGRFHMLELISIDSGQFPQSETTIIAIYDKDMGIHWYRWLLKRITGRFLWKVPAILIIISISTCSMMFFYSLLLSRLEDI